jgi:hypothetical protein
VSDEKEMGLHILRGKRIEEFSIEDLNHLRTQIENELPQELPDEMNDLSSADHKRLLELDLIDEELERRS